MVSDKNEASTNLSIANLSAHFSNYNLDIETQTQSNFFSSENESKALDRDDIICLKSSGISKPQKFIQEVYLNKYIVSRDHQLGDTKLGEIEKKKKKGFAEIEQFFWVKFGQDPGYKQ